MKSSTLARLCACVLLPMSAKGMVIEDNPISIDGSSAPFDASGNYDVLNAFDDSQREFAGAGFGLDTTFALEFGTAISFDRIVVVNRNSPAAGDWIGNFSVTPDGGLPYPVERPGARGESGIHPLGATLTGTKFTLDVDTLGPGAGSPTNTGAMEIILLKTPTGGELVDSVAVVNAAEAFNSDYRAANAVDGRIGWSTGGGLTPEFASRGQGAATFVEFDFGAVIPILGFDWFDRPPASDRVSSFSVTFSADAVFTDPGDTVVQVDNFGLQMALGHTFTAAVNARYARFQVLTVAGAANSNTGLSEMLFYRSGAPTTVTAFVSSPPVAATRYARENHTFTAAAGGTPPLTLQWQKNGVDIPDATSPVLTLTNLQASDDALYTFSATNAGGTGTSTPVRLTVDTTPGDPAKNLLVYLPFDETTGAVAADSAGGDNPGALLNFDEATSPWQTGRIGNALFFNPLSPEDNDVVVVTDPGTFDFSINKQFSASCWVNAVPGASQDSGGGIICKGEGGGGEQFCLDLTGTGYRFYIWTGEVPNAAFVLQTTILPDGSWQHLTVVYNQAKGRMKVFLNGAEIMSGTPPAALLAGNADITIGSRPFQGGYTLNFQGLIDDVRLYDRDITPLDIEAIMATQPPVAGDVPALSASRVAGGVEISWPGTVTGWVLEESNSLQALSWSLSQGVVNNKLTVLNPAGKKFYRLRRQ